MLVSGEFRVLTNKCFHLEHHGFSRGASLQMLGNDRVSHHVVFYA